ncbi:MAG: hypothetical protein QXO71_09470 [Candidatus Jordarchaeaceae archaeon]
MSVKLNPSIDALIFGTIVSSLDKMGLNPMLLARQVARSMTPTIGTSIKQLLGKNLPSNLEEHCKVSEEFTKAAGTADPNKSKIFASENTINMNIVDCAFLKMADLGKKLGYKACPLCIEAFCESALTSAVNMGETEDIQVENNENTCMIKIKLMEK